MPRSAPAFGARFLEALHVPPSDVRPDHLASEQVRAFAHCVAFGLIVDQVVHGRGNRLRIAKRHEPTTPVRQHFFGVPVWR